VLRGLLTEVLVTVPKTLSHFVNYSITIHIACSSFWTYDTVRADKKIQVPFLGSAVITQVNMLNAVIGWHVHVLNRTNHDFSAVKSSAFLERRTDAVSSCQHLATN
jgi:hypothetical protein